MLRHTVVTRPVMFTVVHAIRIVTNNRNTPIYHGRTPTEGDNAVITTNTMRAGERQQWQWRATLPR